MRNSNSGPNHDRYVHLEFPSTAATTTTTLDANGALYGNGYGGYDDMIQNTIAAILDHHHSSPAADQSVSNLSSHHHQWLAATDNSSSSKLAWTCTGLLGTFTADLYAAAGASETIQISTHPQHFSQGMFSWFPIYFPSIHPIYVPANAVVYVDLWRKCTPTRVWYEWSFTVALATGTNGATSTPPPPTTTTTTTANNNNNNVGATIVVDATTGPMEVDDDDPTVGGRQNTTSGTKSSHQEKEYTIIYVSPIHNPGGRSSFVSVV
jgi:PRMT5 oligomerisation domain